MYQIDIKKIINTKLFIIKISFTVYIGKREIIHFP